jgi:hypothetical protein
MFLIQLISRRSSELGVWGALMRTFGTNTTSVFSTDLIVSCGMMLTPVMSFSGPSSVATRRGSKSASAVPPLMLSHWRPAAHSVSYTP